MGECSQRADKSGGLTIFLLENLRHRAAVVACPGFRLVDLRAIRLIVPRFGVPVTLVIPAVSIRMVPFGLHLAVLPSEVRVRAVTRTWNKD